MWVLPTNSVRAASSGFHQRRGMVGERVGFTIERMTDAGDGAGDVVHVLHREAPAVQRAAAGGVKMDGVEAQKAVFQFHESFYFR